MVETQPQPACAVPGRVFLILVVTVPPFFLYFTGGRGWARSINPTVISYHIISYITQRYLRLHSTAKYDKIRHFTTTNDKKTTQYNILRHFTTKNDISPHFTTQYDISPENKTK